VASTAAEQTRLENKYRSRDNIEPVNSQLAVLFATLVRARLPAISEFTHIPADLDVTEDDPGQLSELRDVLDDQVLATVVEEAFDSADEAELDAVLASFAHASLVPIKSARTRSPSPPSPDISGAVGDASCPRFLLRRDACSCVPGSV
jgi:hypothetical protein